MRTLNHVSDGDLAKSLATLRHPQTARRHVVSLLSEAEAYELLQEELTGITAEDVNEEPTQADIEAAEDYRFTVRGY